MKIFAPLLALLGGTYAAADDDACMICEFVGVADSEENAQSMMEVAVGDPNIAADTTGEPLLRAATTLNSKAVDDINPCLHGSRSKGFDEAVASGAIVKDQTSTNCVSKFFIYHAKDINRYVYGVIREASSSAVTASQVDLAHFEGIKAWQESVSSDGSLIATVPAVSEFQLTQAGGGVSTAGKYRNLGYVRRGGWKFNNADANAKPTKVVDTNGDVDATSFQAFSMDGREAAPSDLATRQTNKQPTTEAVQSTPFTLCLVCTGAQEFSAQPTTAADITDPCWNPSGSSVFKTDDTTARDINKYCVPNNGMCSTTTWQYKTKNDLQTTSFWVGVTRGCQANDGGVSGGVVSAITSGASDISHGTNRAADGMKKFVRYYIATNSASKAKDNAKYPDAGTNTGSTVGKQPFALANGFTAANVYSYIDASTFTNVADSTCPGSSCSSSTITTLQEYYKRFGYATAIIPASATVNGLVDASTATGATCGAPSVPATCGRPLIQTLTPQFMSSDGAGPPDLPTIAAAVSELECLSCATPIANTNGDNNCVTAKTTQTVKCKTLACAAIVSNYKLDASDTAETYYYAKRGCAATPEDGITTGDQAQADSFVIPKGYTGIKQTNQRVTTTKANTIQASSASIATVMDCYSCDVHMIASVAGANPSEPSYDSIKDQDTSLCWQTFPPQADSSIAATGTSGRCETSCYVSAYKYKETSGSSTSPVTTFHWHLERGCAKADAPVTSGTVTSPDLFSVSITNYACDYKNGTLCNSQLESYDTTLQLKTQTVRKIQCYTCETPAGNSDPAHSCYTVPSTAKAVDCPDLSYVSCFATETAFNQSSSESVYSMTRGCSKDPSGTTSTAVEGFTNVESTTTVCTSSSCNKINGKTGDLILANADSSSEPVDETEDEVVEEEEENEVDEETAVDPESGAPAIFGSALLLISLLFN